MKKTQCILAIIILIGSIFRFYKLGEIPAGLHRDEAFLGYNAYSILKTGRDMSGNVLPLHLKSFVYSPAGYSYFSIPPIAIFGLNPFSIRFASAFFAVLTIPLLFFLVLELANNVKLNVVNSHVALLSAFLLAISPWHINLSRTATENILVTFFLTTGILFLFRKKILCAFISFFLTLLLYQAPRAFLPLFIPILLWKTRTLSRSSLFLYVAMILLPLVFVLASPQRSLRLRTVSLFSEAKTQLTIDEYIREDGVSGTSLRSTQLFHNKMIGYTNQFLQNYASHFSYQFFFTDQMLPERYQVSGSGSFYLFELPLLILGLYVLITGAGTAAGILLPWILLVPVGSSLAFDDLPNVQRTVMMIPALSVVASLAIKTIPRRGIVVAALSVIGLYNVASYAHQYFVHQPIHKPWNRHEGYKELVSVVNSQILGYKKAIITNRESAPAIFFLFFGSYDPHKYLSQTRHRQIRDYDRENFDRYEFSLEECPLRISGQTGLLIGEPDILYVNYGTCATPASAKELYTITRGDQSIIFRIVSL